ncbi:MAG: glycoside hydrolase family 43 protein [Lachnospiraceae bacterium]|nr:glycoside hydrolase family 43 protein [Lachnospiraceae bacterium]
MKYKNPIVRGMYPDPSVCRAGDKYYMVCSTFQYFPGVPLFESEDMVNWKKIGHCLTRTSQLYLKGAQTTGGIYAPTIRYNNGRFYMVTTNVSIDKNFYVYTDDIYGEWSEPIYVEQGGIDPSLYFEGDRSFFISNGEDEQGLNCIRMCEIDIVTGRKLSETRPLWYGSGGRYIEAPHLYKFGKYYYILDAEGGTEYGHMVNYARSENIGGPFEAFPKNPVLTNRNLGGYQLQGTGHGDVIEDKDGNWWFIHLAFRQIDRWQPYHHLGREVCLVPVEWSDGWFYMGNGTAKLEYELPDIPGTQNTLSFHKTFADLSLKTDWVFLREYCEKQYEFGEDYLKIKASADDIFGLGYPSFAAIRQSEFQMEIQCRIESRCKEAGITLYMDERHHYDIYLNNDSCVVLRYTIGCVSKEMQSVQMQGNHAEIKITTDALGYRFYIMENGVKKTELGYADTRYLSSEVASGFTGVMIGLYAVDDAEQTALFTDLLISHDE